MKINSFGTANPERRLSQKEIVESFCRFSSDAEKHNEALQILFRKAGVENRFTVLTEDNQREIMQAPNGVGTCQRMKWYEQYAPELAWKAATDCLRKSSIMRSEVTHLITVSCTGFYAPGLEISLVSLLNLSPDISRTHIGFQGCHGAFNALKVASAFISEDPASNVLIVAIELCTLHLNFRVSEKTQVQNTLFADGAAAALCSSRDPCLLRLRSTHSAVIPDTAEYMGWKIGDTGFQMTLSPVLPKVIEGALPPLLDEWSSQREFSKGEIKGFAIHPGGPRILRACQRALNLTEKDLHISKEVLRTFGNMSSPTILFILNELVRSEVSTPYLALGFGPGLSTEFLLFD